MAQGKDVAFGVDLDRLLQLARNLDSINTVLAEGRPAVHDGSIFGDRVLADAVVEYDEHLNKSRDRLREGMSTASKAAREAANAYRELEAELSRDLRNSLSG